MDYKEEVRNVASIGRWTFFAVCLRLLLPIFLFLAIVSGVLWLAGVGTGIVGRVVNPDAAISNLEWFTQQYRDIQAMEGQIKDAAEAVQTFKEMNGEAKDWAFDQRFEAARLNTNLTGLKQARRNMIETYNARASMITRKMWKDSSLPQQIQE